MYSKIDFWRFALASIIVSVPCVLLERESKEWGWTYVSLILLMMSIYHAEGIRQFQDFIERELGG